MSEYMQTQARICPLCHDDHSSAMTCEYYEKHVKVFPLLHFIAVKNGHDFHYHEKTEYDARIKASVELGTCSDFYQVKNGETK